MFINNTLGIDFGTCNIKIFNQNKKKIINERNIIAIENKDRVLAVGNEAFEMYEKAPDEIEVVYPISGGVIASIAYTKMILHKFLGRGLGLFSKTCDYYIAIPSDISEVQKRAFNKLITSSNIQAKKVYVVDSAVADAVGVGIDVHKAQGVFVMNIGADTAEISVLSMGSIVLSKMIQVGGNRIDETIMNFLKRKYSLVVGEKTAEHLKKTFCCAVPERPDSKTVVAGRDVVTGLPIEKEISQNEVSEALNEVLSSIVESARMILERTPPELSSDILKDGLYLTGGTSELRRLDDYLASALGIKVNRFENPSESVVRGLAKIICDPNYNELATEPREKIYY